MATFTVTTDTNYSSLSSPANGDIVQVSQGARFTINTSTVRLVTVECTSLGEIYIENTSTSTPIFLNLGTSTVNGLLRAEGGGKITVRGDWITIGTSNGTASQTFNTPTDAGSANYSRLGGVWVAGKWWPTVPALTDFDSDETGEVCVHNTTLNRIEFGDGTAGKIPPNGATIQIPNIQIRYSDTASTLRQINLDLYQTGTADFRILALDGYVGAGATADFHAGASQWDWDRVCMDVGSSGNTNLRWAWDNPDGDSSMTDCCFSRVSGSTREFQILSIAAKFTLTRCTFLWLLSQNPTISGNGSQIIDCRFLAPSVSIAPNVTISGRQAYIRGWRQNSRGALIVSGTQSVVEDVKITHRVTRTSTTAAGTPSVQITGELCTLNGVTDWKSTNNYFNPPSNNGIILVSGLNAQAFNIAGIGDNGSTQGRVIQLTGRGTALYDASITDNAPRGNIVATAPQIFMRNVFTTDTTVSTDASAAISLMNNADLELVMSNYRTTETRILNGASTGSQSRYIALSTNGIGSDISDVLMLRPDIGRTGGMLLVVFGVEKTREWYQADAGNTGAIFFDNAGKVFVANSGDRFVITGRKHFGITGWGDVLINGTNPLNFTYEFRAAEGDNAHSGSWLALTTANLTSATSGFTNMRDNGVTLQYRITHNASNLTDNVNLLEVRCTVDGSYTRSYTVRDVASSGDYTLHRRLDMADCTVDGTLTFTVAGTYYLTDCTIGTVVNTSGGSVTIEPIGSTTIATNTGPNITINVAATTYELTGLVSGTEVRVYTGTDPSTATLVAGTESSGTSFSFTNNYAGQDGYIMVFALGYLPIKISLTFPSTTTSVPIQQSIDRIYNNP